MTDHHSLCQTKKLTVAHLVSHRVSFRGPDAGHACDLPENHRGDVSHVFENESIYPLKCETTVSTTVAALKVVGPAGIDPVPVQGSSQGPFRARPSTGIASQVLEHNAGTGIVLPHTAAAEFTTTVTGPWGTLRPRPCQPIISVTLKL
jgi:hypothetical protein